MAHSLDTMHSFGLLGLIPPTTEAGIEASITQLKEKRAHYDVLPRAPKKAAATAKTNASEADEEKKVEASIATDGGEKDTGKRSQKSKSGNSNANTPPPSVEDSSLFPHLPGSKPAIDMADSKQKWGPKPVDDTAAPSSVENGEHDQNQNDVVGEEE